MVGLEAGIDMDGEAGAGTETLGGGGAATDAGGNGFPLERVD